MSKIEAYICDYGNHIVTLEEAVGVSPTEDMFDKMHSYPTVMDPRKTNIHYCTGCYRDDVSIRAANLVNRRKDERAYELKILELSFSLRKQTVKNFFSKKLVSLKKKK